MDQDNLKLLLAKGAIESVIGLLLDYSKKYVLSFKDEIILISSRFHAIKKDQIRGSLNNETYNIEINALTRDILQVIDYLSELDEGKLKVASVGETRKEIDSFIQEFERCRSLENTPSRLRMKNSLAQKISQKLLQMPDLTTRYLNDPPEGFICGICKRIQMVPEFDDLDIIEKVVPRTESKFTKGTIVNSIAELIYSGKIRLGDDQRIYSILTMLKKDVDITLAKNIDRVEAALDYLLDRNK